MKIEDLDLKKISKGEQVVIRKSEFSEENNKWLEQHKTEEDLKWALVFGY